MEKYIRIVADFWLRVIFARPATFFYRQQFASICLPVDTVGGRIPPLILQRSDRETGHDQIQRGDKRTVVGMENHKLVLPGHLNHYGFLFGGNLLQWVDEYAWIAASLDYPGAQFVTVGMDKVEFRKNIRNGTILKFVIERGRVGRTSVQYGVLVFRGNGDECDNELLFSTNVALVNVDAYGHKLALPRCMEARRAD